VLFILIARHLGVLIFGQFSLAYTFFIIFQVPAEFGLPNLIVREVAKDKSHFGKYLVNGHFIVLLASLASFGIWALLIHLLGYSPQVVRASYLLGLALIPFAMGTVCEAIFKAFERMQFIAYAFASANLVKIGLVWLFLSRGLDIKWIIAMLAMIQWILLLIEWYFIYRYFFRPAWVIDLAFCRKLAKVATTFLGIAAFAVVLLRLNIIVLSKLRGEVDVGLYNAAFQLTYFFMLLSMSLKQSIYPILSRSYNANAARFKRYSEGSIEFLLSFAIPLAVCFLFLADSILLVYKDEFIAAASLLRLLGWVLIPVSFNSILGGVLLASNRQKANLLVQIINTACLLGLSLFCIHRFGLLGAGMALLVSHMISFTLLYRVVFRDVFSLSIFRVIWRPAVSGFFLAGFLALIREGHGLLLVLSLAVAV
jgi:O-antigen/teichoic acid export membrane protein